MKKLILLLLTTASLSATPQAIVFDFGDVMAAEQNIEEAKKMGLDAILFQSHDQIQQELKNSFGESGLNGKNGKNGEDGTNGRSCLFGQAGHGGHGGNAD